MIPFGSQRANGADLARHLSNSVDNETVEIADLRGCIADDLAGAFAEWEVQASSLTRSKNYIYSLSINPDERQGRWERGLYFDFIERVEGAFGVADQPRAVVFHTKVDGAGHLREHCHVAWTLTDVAAQKAIRISYDKYKLMDETRRFAADHNLKLPDGYYDRTKNWSQHTQADAAQRQEDGLSPEERRAVITDMWHTSDGARAFVSGLAEHGYILATGRRPYILVDGYGGTFALPRMIADKQVRAKDVQAFLEQDFPPESLPSVEEALDLASAAIDDLRKDATLDDEREIMLQTQQELRHALLAKLDTLKADQACRDAQLHEQTRSDHDALEERHRAENSLIEQTRAQRTPSGLAGFLAKVSGMAFVQGKLHAYQDKRREARHEHERMVQAEREAQRRADQQALHDLQLSALERERRAQEANFAREEESLCRQEKKHDAIQARDGFGHMPSVPAPKPVRRRGDVFGKIADPTMTRPDIDLTFDFGKAAEPTKRDISGTGSAPDISIEHEGASRGGKGR
jgi:hypothetical protein